MKTFKDYIIQEINESTEELNETFAIMNTQKISKEQIVTIFKENYNNLNNDIIIDGEPKIGFKIVSMNQDEIVTANKSRNVIELKLYNRINQTIMPIVISTDLINKIK